MEPILQTKHVSKVFGGLTAVNQVDFCVQRQTIASIIGPNGAGKTTLFNCISGFYVPEMGDVVFEGRSIRGLGTDKIAGLGISRTYQNIRLFSNLTALENILVGRQPHLKTGWVEAVLTTPRYRREEAAALDEARRLLRFVGLAGLGDTQARNLPYGAQRRLEIARALANQPRLLLLDEPSLGLAPLVVQTIFATVDAINREGVTILLVEQNAHVALKHSHRAYVLESGQIQFSGPSAALRNDPRVKAAYLGEGT